MIKNILDRLILTTIIVSYPFLAYYGYKYLPYFWGDTFLVIDFKTLVKLTIEDTLEDWLLIVSISSTIIFLQTYYGNILEVNKK